MRFGGSGRGSRQFIGGHIEGLKELDRALKKLPLAVQKRVLRATLKKAGRPIAADAAVRAPRDRGDLAESITVKTELSRSQRRKMRKSKGEVVMFIGAARPKGAHAHLVEFGTEKMAAQPFLRTAWDAGKAAALETIKTDLWKAISRAAKRLARRAAKGKA